MQFSDWFVIEGWQSLKKNVNQYQRDLRDMNSFSYLSHIQRLLFLSPLLSETTPCLLTTEVWFSSNVQEVKDGNISDNDILWKGTLCLNHMFALLILQFGWWPYFWSVFSHILYLKEKQVRVVLVSYAKVPETTSSGEWRN